MRRRTFLWSQDGNIPGMASPPLRPPLGPWRSLQASGSSEAAPVPTPSDPRKSEPERRGGKSQDSYGSMEWDGLELRLGPTTHGSMPSEFHVFHFSFP